MSSFIYNGREVYDAKDLKEKFPVFFHGCADNTKSVAKKRSIPADVILYAIKTSTGWNSSTPDIRRSSLLLDKIWVDENMPKFLEEGIITPSGKTYLPAPDVLELSDDEKLRDDEGNIYEIEVRGERSVDKCYFRASDVETMLEMKHIAGTLQRGVTDRDTISFEPGKHYQTMLTRPTAASALGYQHPILFLTYTGLVQLLFTRRHPIAKIFRQWATNVLFTAHFNLLKPFDVMKHDNKTIYNYWKEILLTPSVVYLFKLGKVKDLRSSLKIDLEHRYSDDLWVVKFGKTTQLKARTNQHEEHYGLLPRVELHLVLQTRFDIRYLSDAENTIRNYFKMTNTLILDNSHYKELAVASDEDIATNIKHVYDSLEEENAAYMLKATEAMEKYLKLSILEELPRKDAL